MLSVDRQRWLDRVIGRPLCGLLTLLHRARSGDAPPREVRRILVVLLSEMGALVLTRPMFDRLRDRYPAANIYVLCSQQNAAALDLLDLIPRDQVFVVRSGSVGMLVRDSARALRGIRALGMDVVLDLELFARISAIYAGLCGAPIRVGFHRHTQEGLYRGDFFNRPVLYNPYRHIAEQFVTLADAIEGGGTPTVKRLPMLQAPALPPMRLRPGEVEDARRKLHRDHPGVAGKPLVFVCPGAGLLPLRAWPVSSYARVAEDLVGHGCAVAIVGLPEDKPLARQIQAACTGDGCIDLTGYTASVRDLAVLLHLGSLLITADGGTGHFAALTPIPSIVLYGPETPALYGPLSDRTVTLYKGLTCSPCLTAYNHRRSPCDGDNQCMKLIAPEEVLARAYERLGATALAGDRFST
jgi:lipopolysaccharide heptosyltransferase II